LKTTLALISILVFAISCNEKEGIWDKLTPAERAAVEARARTECIAASNERFNAFKDSSISMFTSTSWNRGKAFKHELKNGETIDTSYEIQVWKQLPTEIYFLVEKTIGTTTDTYFLRLLAAQNETMIEDIQEEVCSKRLTLGNGTNPINITREYVQTGVTNRDEITDTYRMNISQLAYIGATHNLSRKIVKKKISNNEVVSTVNLTSTFTSISSPPALNPDYTTYPQKFCDVAFTDPYVLPFPLAACSAVLPAGWDDMSIP
jgi:hypothetical protein